MKNRSRKPNDPPSSEAESKDAPGKEAAGSDALARAYLDLWQEHWSRAFSDPATAHSLLAWLQALQPNTGPEPQSKGAASNETNRPSPAAPAPSGGRTDVGGSVDGELDARLADIDSRLAALERRIDALLAAAAKPSGTEPPKKKRPGGSGTE